jgi:transcriptional regulator with XRE-family HTH domain
LGDLSKLEKGASYPGLEIIAKLATVLEVEPTELLRMPPGMPERERSR